MSLLLPQQQAIRSKLIAPSPWKVVLQTTVLLAVAAVLSTVGPQIIGFAPFLAVAIGWLWFILPGFVLSLILFRRLFWIERIPISFVLAIGLSTPYTVAAVLLSMQLDHYLAVSLAVLILLILVFFLQKLRALSKEVGEPQDTAIVLPVQFELGTLAYLLILVAVVGLLTFIASQWLPVGDDLAGLPHFAEVLRLGQIVGTEPFHGSGTPLTPRNELIVAAYQYILVAKVAGASPVQLLMNTRSVFIILAFLSLFTFLHQTFKNLHQALFLLTLWSVFLLATTHAEGVGSDLTTRIIQDKFLGWFVVVPVVLVLMQWFLASQRWRHFLALGIGTFGAALLHPITLTQVVILGGSFSVLYLALERSRRAVRGLLLMGVILVICLAVPAVQFLRYTTVMPVDLAGLSDAVEFGRLSQAISRRRLWLLQGGRFALHPSIILQPIILLAYLWLPVLVHLRKSNAARLILGSLVTLPLLLYVPPLAALAARVVTPYLLWRLAWPLPTLAILTLGWIAWLAAGGLASLVGKLQARASFLFQYAATMAIVILAFAVARPDIEAGLVSLAERFSVTGYTACSTARDALAHLDQLTHDEPADVLASRTLNFCIPGGAALANVLEFRGYGTVNRLPLEQIAASVQRVEDASYFTSATLVDDLVVAMLERYDTDYILMEKERAELDLQIRHLPTMFTPVYTDHSYSLYAVTKPIPLTALSGPQPAALLSPIVEGNAALRQRRWDDAARIFQQVLQRYPEQVLAYQGLVWHWKVGGTLREPWMPMSRPLSMQMTSRPYTPDWVRPISCCRTSKAPSTNTSALLPWTRTGLHSRPLWVLPISWPGSTIGPRRASSGRQPSRHQMARPPTIRHWAAN
jgi:hypothetical protein